MTGGRLAALILAGAIGGCGADAARREYLTALRGDEQGMTREHQIAHLDRAIALAPRRAEYREARAIYRIDLRNFARARDDLDRAIALADRPYLRFLRGLTSCQSRVPRAALADFDAAIAGQPENDQFYRGRALARAAVGDGRGALEDAEHLVRRAPQQGESHYALGVALAALGRDAEAVAAFDRALARRPDLVYAWAARAVSEERLGRAANARTDRETAAATARDRDGCAPCLDPYRY